jgi:NADPH-dependent 2,4-dienoyl-CoA reductase/sulfur reductase-like enzyme
MTAREKAIELVDNFYQRFPLTMDVITTRGDLSWEYDNWKEAKQCALIAVDEMLDFRNGLYMNEGSIVHQYLMDVKQEIEKL